MKRRQLLFIALLCFVLPITVRAQAPVASFTASDTAGCSPIVVQFTDQSTGSPTSWSWDLGNGGNSSLQNPSATYINPGTYMVILTATNANGSSKDTAYITVYASPQIAFSADTTAGCGTKTVSFTNTTVPGGTGSVSYLWDFGDGASSTATSPMYTYTSPGTYTVSLVVTNSLGCTKTLKKTNYITVLSKPTANFSTTDTFRCNPPYNVSFSNSSSGASSYTWDFGDGSSSTATTPSHTYTASGSYTVRLIASSANGCTDTITKTNYIVVDSSTANFTFPSPVCKGTPMTFTNTSTPIGSSHSWAFGNGGTSSLQSPAYTYTTAGTFNVTLVESYGGGCRDTVIKSVTISPSPAIAFTTNDTAGCTVPFNASFTNTTTGAVSYAWNFGPGTSTATNPSYNYTSLGNYTVQLIATSANGCKDTLIKPNYIKLAVPNASMTASPANTCVNTPVSFLASVSGSIAATNYRWDFGDGTSIVNCSGCSFQSHSYTSVGTYNASVVITTAPGCTDTVSKTITISSKPTAAFTGSPLTICPEDTVAFTNTSTGATSYIWSFGDGGSSSALSPTHPYALRGTYTVRLIAVNTGCRDTLTRTAYVTVQDPEAKFTPGVDCSNKLKFTFTDNSVNADTYSWDFGDGNTSTTAGTVTHTYAAAGTYTVTLTATNTTSGCTHEFSEVIYALPSSLPGFTANDTTICRNTLVSFKLNNDVNGSKKWDFGDNTTTTTTDSATTHNYSSAGTYTVKVVITDVNGCLDSVTKTNYIKVGGPVISISIQDPDACKNEGILFTDNSNGGPFGIASRSWNFGDGNTAVTTSDTVSHSYANTGQYNIQLNVTDSNGCSAGFAQNNAITIHQPTAQFTTTDTLVCAGDTVQFSNTSVGIGFSSLWDFGDATSSTSTNPFHIYNSNGSFSVSLKVTDIYGCQDSTTRVDYVTVQKPTAAFAMSDTVGDCPPLTVNFTDSSINAVSRSWTFGNNTQSTITNPSTTYVDAGIYNVQLIVTNSAGCTDTATNTVTVNGPSGSFVYTPTAGCSPLTVNFTATTTNTASYIWDLNNGVTQVTSSNTFSYTYTQGGKFLPKLILSDGASCQVPIENSDTIVIDGVVADFSYTAAGNFCNTDTIYFDDTVSGNLTPITSKQWNFGDGNTSTATDPSHYYNGPGSYTVTLIVTNGNGCKDTVIKTVTINQLPNVTVTTSADSLCPDEGAAQLTATGAATYAWTPTSGLSCTNCPNPLADPNATTTYIVTGTDTNSCTDTAMVTITINPKPTVSAGSNKTICTGASTTLTATGTGVSSYTWSPSTGLSCTNCVSTTASPTSTTVYTVIGTNSVGCSDTSTTQVAVVTKPNVTAGNNQVICLGDTALLTGAGASTYEWSPVSSLACDTCDTTAAYPTATTTYTLVGGLGNGCLDTATVTVTVNPLPNVSAGTDKVICINDSASLQATGATTYTWAPATGLSCTNCANPKAAPTTTTSYVVTGTDGNGCMKSDTVIVTVNPLPNVNAGTDKTICFGFNTTLTATGASTYTWSPAAGLSCTNCASPTASPALTTSYIVSGTDANGCVNTDTVIVNVNQSPIVSAGTNKVSCSADTVLLVATGATSYTWSPTSTLSCNTCDSTYAYPTTTTVYTVIGTDTNGCKDTANVTVSVYPVPNVSAGADKSICAGGSTSLTATGATSYTWSPAAGLSCTSCANPTASPATTTTYTIIGTDNNGCTDTATIKITVNPLPNVNAGTDQSICLNKTVQLQATGASTYTWSPSTGLSCTNCANPIASPTTTTAYTVTGTDANGCTNTDQVNVTVKPLPTIVASNDTAICIGDTIQISATGGGGYKWTPATGLGCNTCATTTAAPTITTTYTVTGTGANGCENTDDVDITVNPLPTVSAGPDVDVCLNDSVQLNATGAVDYVWSPAIGLGCTNCPNPKTSPPDTLIYLVIGTDANGCSSSDDIKVSVKPLPVVSVTKARDTICTGDTTQLLATGATTYAWSPTLGLSCTNCANPVSTPSASTTYIVTGTDANGCSDTASVRVLTRPRPSLNVTTNAAYCVGGSAQLGVSGAVSYVWAPASNLSCTACDSPVANPTTTTAYTVTGTDVYGCENTAGVTVTVNPLPNVDAGNDISVCDGDSVQLNATGAVTYNWSPATNLSCTGCQGPKALVTNNITYTVGGTDANGCVNTDQVSITVIRKQPVNYSPDDSICIGESTILTADGGTAYEWSPASGLNTTSGSSVEASPLSTTTYRVIVTQGTCFKDTGNITVTVNPLPTVEAGADQSVTGGTKVTFEPQATRAVSYQWTPAQDLSCSDCSSPVLDAQRTTTFTVTVTSQYGCTAQDSLTITVSCGLDQIFVPNTFTPNGDGLNDRFYPSGKGAVIVKRFSVFNRWGELLYDVRDIPINDPNYGWDGTYKNEPLKPDVFVYILKGQCESGEPIDLKGDISLVR